jgi:HEAT repeat protein
MFVVIRDERCQAAEVLGKRGDPQGIETLLALCGDSEVCTRDEAVQALGVLGDERTSEPFSSLEAPRPYAESAALQDLGDLLPKIVERLLAVCTNRHEAGYVRANAVYALQNMGAASPDVLAVLMGLCQDTDKDVRRCATEFIGELGLFDEAHLDTLYQVLEDGSASVGTWAALSASAQVLRHHEVEAWAEAHGYSLPSEGA